MCTAPVWRSCSWCSRRRRECAGCTASTDSPRTCAACSVTRPGYSGALAGLTSGKSLTRKKENLIKTPEIILFSYPNSPVFLLGLFVFSVLSHEEMLGGEYTYPGWSIAVGWVMTGTTVSCVPLYIIYKFIITPGSCYQVSCINTKENREDRRCCTFF